MTLLALGDSTSCGEGVGVRVRHEHTWPALLGRCLGLPVQVVARPGARACDLLDQLEGELPTTVPTVATVLVGCNDVLRPSGRDVETDLLAVVDALLARGATVVVMRLHDPTRLLSLPGVVRGVVVRRVAAVNAAVDRVVLARPSCVLLDLDGLAGMRQRSAWAVDRLHPSVHGHRLLAGAVARALDAPQPDPAPEPSPPGLVSEAAWFLRHALPWVALRGPELLPRRRPAVAGLASVEPG